MDVFFIESIRFRLKDSFFLISSGLVLLFISLLSLYGIMPISAFFILFISAVFLFGLAAVKITSTPERFLFKNDSFEYTRGDKKIFAIGYNRVKSISFEGSGLYSGLHDKLFIVYFLDGSEVSYPYRYLNQDQVQRVIEAIEYNI